MTNVVGNDRTGRRGTLLRFQRGRHGGSERAGSSRYDAAFREASARFTAHHRLLARERLAADRVIEQLVGQPIERRQLLIENSPRFQTWGLAERLIEEGRRHIGELDASSQLDLTRTAVEVSCRIDPRIYGRYRHHDLQAIAWGNLGNSLRIAGRYDAAAQAFAQAHRHLDLGTGCAIEKAQLESFEVSLLNVQAHFESALVLANRALKRLPEGLGRLHIELLHKRAVAEQDPTRAAQGFEKVLSIVSADRQPLVAFVALQGLAMTLAGLGRFDEGHDAVVKAGRLAHHAKRWGRIYLEWSAAVLAARTGQTTTAIGIFSGLWRTLGARAINDGLLVSAGLELVNTHAACDGPAQARRLCETIGDLLVQRGYSAAVLEGWAEVGNRIAMGRLPQSVLDSLNVYFRRAWVDPTARLVLPA